MADGPRKEIDRSPFRDEIRAMLKEKGHSDSPTYAELSDQIKDRFGEEYSVKQLRNYMNEEIEPDERLPPEKARKEIEKRRETIDIAAKRQDLVEIQEERMEETLEVEEDMGGMILEQATEQIQVLDSLLDSLSEDYERLGILQSTSDVNVEVNQVQADPFSELMAESLGVALEDVDEDDEPQMDDEADAVEATFEQTAPDESGGEELEKDPDEIDFEDLPDE